MRLFVIFLTFALLGCSTAHKSPKLSPADFMDGNRYLPTRADQKVCYDGDMRKDREPKCGCSHSMKANDSDLWYCDWEPPPALVFTLKINSAVCAEHPELATYCNAAR